MIKKYIILFIFIFTIVSFFFFLLKKEDKKIVFSTPVFFQYISFEKKELNTKLPTSLYTKKEQTQKKQTVSKNNNIKKSFFLFSGCTTSLEKPDSLFKKFKKNTSSSSTSKDETSLIQNFDCGLIQTIIPLPF